MKLEIFLNNDVSAEITVNNVQYSVSGHTLSLTVDACIGVNVITVKSNVLCKILDVKIDNDSVRELLYLSYTKSESGGLTNPDTELDERKQWIFPMIYPLSFFSSYVKNKIPNGILGSNLFDTYKFYYPESISLSSNRFPKIISDYFKFDSEFGIVKKTNDMFKHLPFWPADDYATVPTNLVNEIESNKIVCNITGSSSQTNLTEYNNSGWRYSFFIDDQSNTTHWSERFVWDKDQFPELIDFLSNMPDQTIVKGLYAELMPGSFIYPHHDSVNKDWDQSMIVRYYIPLCVNNNVHFKFANYGKVNLAVNNFVNVRNYVHSVVNDSDQIRKILALDIELSSETVGRYFPAV